MRIFIPFVNNYGCLKEATDSLGKYRNLITLIDNSKERNLFKNLSNGNTDIIQETVITLEKPMSFSETLNFVSEKAEDAFLFMHSDTVVSEEAYEQLVKEVEFQKDKWGIIFTNYDSFCAINNIAFKEVGGADTNFFQYFTDNDLYRRMNLAGYKEIKTDIQVKHKVSMTIKSDPEFMAQHNINFPLNEKYYIQKWGGKPNEETFTKAFNL